MIASVMSCHHKGVLLQASSFCIPTLTGWSQRGMGFCNCKKTHLKTEAPTSLYFNFKANLQLSCYSVTYNFGIAIRLNAFGKG